jgi:glycerol-3-phosphate dehydrogenase (NAD(P)+)
VKIVGTNVTVLGGGSWGTALAILLANKGIDITMWVRNKEQIDKIKSTGENSKYLPGAKFPHNIKLDNNIDSSVYNKELIVLAVPSHAVRQTCIDIKSIVKKDVIIVNVAKGLENETLYRISQIVEEEMPNSRYSVLSGPSHAEEVCKDMPTTVVAAAKQRQVAEFVQDLFMYSKFRVYTNPDVAGVELGGALKNVIALGAGITDGLGYGDNTKSALMARGIVEMARLGTALGANTSTFAGLSGIGDLITTCTSLHSRNRRAGILIGQGKPLDEVLESVGMVVEGVKTTKAAYKLSQRMGIEMPITSQIYSVLYGDKWVNDAVNDLMLRSKTHEMEDIASSENIDW